MKIGQKIGCRVNDRIDLEVSPWQLDKMIGICFGEALGTDDYQEQGEWRGLKDFLQSRADEYTKLRKKEDSKGDKK